MANLVSGWARSSVGSLASMGRHQRRGYVGQTSLPSPHKRESNGYERGSPSSFTYPDPTPSASPSRHGSSRKRQLRAKWKLDLAPMPRGFESLRAIEKPYAASSVEVDVLGANIEASQHDRKSFKDEPWYRSPIGAGSKSSVILATLKRQDHEDTGFLPRAAIVATLLQSHLGLSEPALLQRYDPAQDHIHFKTFVQHLHFAEKPSLQHENHDIIFRHQRYLEKIHDHAARLIEASTSTDTLAPSPTKLSPLSSSKNQLVVTNDGPDVVLGNSPPYKLAPLVTESSGLTKSDYDTDRLSFEFDKLRRAQRAQAKATTLLAHISRIEEYTRQRDFVTAQQDTLRIANKALHHGEHLARVFDKQHRQLYRLEHQGKGLLTSPQKTTLRSVSKDSMFYVDSND